MRKKYGLIPLFLLLALPAFGQKDDQLIEQFAIIRNIRVLPGPLPSDTNEKQEFKVLWDINPGAASRQFQPFTVNLSVTRADGSQRTDSRQVGGASREATLKLKGNSKAVSAAVEILSTSTSVFTCTEKFSGPNLSVNEPSTTLGGCFVDFLSVTPLAGEEQKKKQTFEVKWKLPAGQDPGRISNFKTTLDVSLNNNTTESDTKSPNPAAGAATLKIKSPGSPVSAKATAGGTLSFADKGTATLNFADTGKDIKK